MTTSKIERVYVPYWDWEEIDSNMWGEVKNRPAYLKKAIEFTGDHKKYGRFMLCVVNEWPNSCLNSLSDTSQNRRAWVGHAACALALGCPESITREAWSHLTNEQQKMANAEADRAIATWENNYRASLGIPVIVDDALLL